MKPAAFELADGARFQPGAVGTANEIGLHLELLREEYKGELTPPDVLKDARNPNSPLHSYFEWTDSAAAEAYRLQQARGLIRSVVAVYVSEERPAVRTRAYVHVPEPGAHHYRPTPEAMSTARTRDLVLRKAWRDWQIFAKKYRDLREFAAMFDAAAVVEKKLSLSKTA